MTFLILINKSYWLMQHQVWQSSQMLFRQSQGKSDTLLQNTTLALLLPWQRSRVPDVFWRVKLRELRVNWIWPEVMSLIIPILKITCDSCNITASKTQFFFPFIFLVLKTFIYIIHNNYTFALFWHISLQFCTLPNSNDFRINSLLFIL